MATRGVAGAATGPASTAVQRPARGVASQPRPGVQAPLPLAPLLRRSVPSSRGSLFRTAAASPSSSHSHSKPSPPSTAAAAAATSASAPSTRPFTLPTQPPPPSHHNQHQQHQHQQQAEATAALFTPHPGSGTVTSYEDEYLLLAPGPELPLGAQVARLKGLLERLRAAPTVEDKVLTLYEVDSVAAFVSAPRNAPVCAALSALPPDSQRVLLSLPAMLQPHVLQEPEGAAPSSPEALRPRLEALAAALSRVDTFYDSVGGLPGYQLKSLQLIVAGLKDKSARKQQQELGGEQPPAAASAPSSAPEPTVTFHVPRGIDLAGEEGSQVGVSAAAQGLASLPFMAEIYPVGGAGDRLGLVDEATGESLPAAMLPYAGRSLMEVMLRDLQAREYLYFQLTGRQVTTPVAIMTSDAKGNHGRVLRLLGELGWAGRSRDAFRLFRQPMVPVVAVEDGRWLLSRPLSPMLKPGGHGAIWKLMWDEGVFEWLQTEHGRRAALVRQISNPMAGTDTTLLALAGAGFSRRGGGAGAFGFMSCERAVGAAEGMNVLQERRSWAEGPEAEGGRWVYDYGVTNVEYTEFERLGLNDEAVSVNSKTSVFPANTNVLYVGLRGARKIVAEAVASGDGEQLLPGLIFNLNKKVAYTDPLGGGTSQVTAGRMESTMQNMSDYLTDRFEGPMDPRELAAGNTLSTFLVSNLRRKVTSSAKKRREPGSARIAQTPDGSFYDLQRNAWQILQRCGLKNVPEPGSPEQYLEKGPGFIFLFHPALGPLWDVVSQKVVGGALAQGSELVLEAAEARLLDLDIDGSLQVYAENVMGHLESPGDTAAATATALHAALTEPRTPSTPASAAAATETLLSVSSLRNGTTHLTMPMGALSAVGSAAAGAGAGSAPANTNASSAAGSATGGGGGILRYGRRCGRVQMVNVRVRNAGIDWTAPGNVYWKHQVARHETCKVVLLGQSEFEAHDVTLSGSLTFVVPDGHRLTVTAADGGAAAGLRTTLTPLTRASAEGFQPSWEWMYSMDSNGAVRLSYVGSVGLRSAPAAAGLVAPVMAAAERQGGRVLDFSI